MWGDAEIKEKNWCKRGEVRVAKMSRKVTERRLECFGHVRRRRLKHVCWQIIDIEPPVGEGREEEDRNSVHNICGQSCEHGWTGNEDGK